MAALGDLNAKQRRFVEEYLIDLNATQAAIRAGYSKKTASIGGFDLLRNPKIAAAIEKRQQARAVRTEITQDRVLRELARVAFSDQRRLVEWSSKGVTMRDSSTISDDDAATVSEVSESVTATGGTTKIKVHDKMRALELIGRHLRMFEDARPSTASVEEIAAALQKLHEAASR